MTAKTDWQEALQVFDSHGSRFGGTVVDELNESRWMTIATARDIDSASLTDFAGRGHRVILKMERESWRLTATADRVESFDFQTSGSWEDAYSDAEEVTGAKTAVDDRDLGTFLARSPEFQVELSLALINDPAESRVNWCRTTETAVALLTGRDWLGVAKNLAGAGRFATLVIQDAGSDRLTCRGWVARGPEADGEGASVEAPAKYVQVWLREERADLPSPSNFLVTDHVGLESIAEATNDLAFALTWLWLAADIESGTDGIPVARFEGARLVQVEIPLGLGTEAAEAIALWDWAVESPAASRREALQQAISLAVQKDGDLPGASGPILRTAKYLLRISEQGLVAEALAARRAARDAATKAAQSAADTSRDVARKTADRMVIQLGAAAGVLLANRQALITESTALLLLWLVLGLLGVTSVVAFFVELKGAREALDAVGTDLEMYRETLTDDDIVTIRNMHVVGDSRIQLARATRIVYWLLATAALGVAAAIDVVSKP